jgi:hypothetical protein
MRLGFRGLRNAIAAASALISATLGRCARLNFGMKNHFRAGFCRRCLGTAIGVTLGTAALAANNTSEKAAVASQPAIELPKFVVTDSRELPQPESWRYGTIPGFEVLTNASDRTTQKLLSDFQTFRDALSCVWPTSEQPEPPVMLILCDKGGKFDTFVPASTDGGSATARASLFLKSGAQTAIVLDLESKVINVQAFDSDDPSSGEDSTQFSIESNKQLYREYVHYLLSRAQPRLPAWFEEGMCQIVMQMKFWSNYIEFGKLEPANTVSAQAGMVNDLNAASAAAASGDLNAGSDDATSADAMAGAPVEDKDFNAVMSRRAIIPMTKFFAVTYNSPEAVNPLGNNTWSKQAYEFVHMGLFGENKKWQKPFTKFLLRAAKEPVTEQMFKECFNMSYKDMQMQLRLYAQFTQYTSIEGKVKGGLPKPQKIALRDATQAEVGRIKGEAQLLAGHKDDAMKEFTAPYIRKEPDADLFAVLGLVQQADGKEVEARKLIAEAVKGGTKQQQAYLELARYHYEDAIKAQGGPSKDFTPEQIADITGLLQSARKLPPLNPAIYERWADTLVHSGAALQKNDVLPLVQGVQLFPGRLKLLYITAALCNKAGLTDAAHSLAEYGIKVSADPATKARFEQLNASLPPVAVVTPAEKPAANPAPVPMAK